MSVNKDIFGPESLWPSVPEAAQYDSSVLDKNRVKSVYFGDSTYYNNNLGLGLTNNKISRSEPIDLSLSYCGLGEESAFSHAKYYSIQTIMNTTVGNNVAATYTEDRQVTNFAFTMGDANRFLYQYWMNANDSPQGNQYRWLPSDNHTSSNANWRMVFLSYFAFNNFILNIRVHCTDGVVDAQGQFTNVHEYDLKTYEDSGHTNYPYVYAVTVVPYVYQLDTTQRTPLGGWQSGRGISILDAYTGTTSAPIGAEMYTYGMTQDEQTRNYILHGLRTSGGLQGGLNYNNNSTEGLMTFYVAVMPDTWKLKKTYQGDTYHVVQTIREYDETFYDETMEAAACFGCFFTPDVDIAETGSLTDPEMYLGVLDQGVGHGQYVHGTENADQPQYGNNTEHTGYDPYHPPYIDPGTDDDANKSVLPRRGLLTPFTGSWVFDQLNLTNVILGATAHYVSMEDAIENWNLVKGELEDSLDFESYLSRQWGKNANPVDCIQSITQYPFNIRPYIGELIPSSLIQIGSWINNYGRDGYEYPAEGYKVGAATIAGSVWCGGRENAKTKFPIEDRNDFRSYAPYISATLYLPFCGSIDLDPQVFVGNSIGVQYIVDWRTGVCLALVYCNDLIVEAVSGQMGNKINLQMLDSITWSSQLANASVQESNAHFSRASSFFSTVSGLAQIGIGAAVTIGSEGAAAPMGVGMMASGAATVANGIIGMEMADVAENKAAYDIGTSPIPTRQISTASPAVNASNEMKARIVVFQSEEETSTNYGHTVGHACLKYGTLAGLGCDGYTVCQTIDTSGIDATQTEKELIRQLMIGGVYV